MKNRLNLFLAELIEDANENGGTCGMVGIVDKVPARAQRQDLTWETFDHRYVAKEEDSYCESYWGHLYYPIQGGKYLDLEFYQ